MESSQKTNCTRSEGRDDRLDMAPAKRVRASVVAAGRRLAAEIALVRPLVAPMDADDRARPIRREMARVARAPGEPEQAGRSEVIERVDLPRCFHRLSATSCASRKRNSGN